MTKFTVHNIETAPPASRPLLEATTRKWGFLPTLQGTLAESPTALEGYETLFGLVAKTSFTPVEQQVAFLSTSVFNECEYCTMGHTYLARAAKMDEAALAALRAGQPIAGDARLEALHRFTTAVVRERGWVDDAEVDAFLAAGYTRAQVLEVLVVVAAKTISNYTNHLTNTPKETFMSDERLAWVAPRKAR